MASELCIPLGHLTSEFLVNSNLWPVLNSIIANLGEASLRNRAWVNSLWRKTIASEYMQIRIPNEHCKTDVEGEEWLNI